MITDIDAPSGAAKHREKWTSSYLVLERVTLLSSFEQDATIRLISLQDGLSGSRERDYLMIDALEMIVRQIAWSVPETQKAAQATLERAKRGLVAPPRR